MELVLGKWYNNSGNMTITDPSYSSDLHRLRKEYSVVKGEWSAYIVRKPIDGWGVRNTKLTAISLEQPPNKFKETNIRMGVDTGQIGIFNSKELPDDVGDYDDQNSLYRICCDLTLNRKNAAGIVKLYGTAIGVVSSSGIGDGFYPVSLSYYRNRVNGITIHFDSHVLLD